MKIRHTISQPIILPPLILRNRGRFLSSLMGGYHTPIVIGYEV
jgi:hypothetical protein